jgi:ribonuclease III
MARLSKPNSKLESELGHIFCNKEILKSALTHRSLGKDNNERLEYLGDALLGFIIAEILYTLHPYANEGELTRLRAMLVKGDTLVKIAKQMDLGEFIKLGTSELKSGGWRRKSILANTIEALIGAIYLDAGLDVCKKSVHRLFDNILKNYTPENLEKDPKTRLQEFLQAQQKNLPVYNVVFERGEAHDKTFIVQCSIPEINLSVQAEGRSKRNAEQAAAQQALNILAI